MITTFINPIIMKEKNGINFFIEIFLKLVIHSID